MYLKNSPAEQLGIIDPVSVLFTGLQLKNLFGIGKKKRALKAIEGQAVGYWTGSYPTDIDWTQYLDADHGDGKVAAVRKSYEGLRKKRDSILIKNNIASPEDYAAWHFTQWGMPEAEKGSKGWIPYRKDGTRYDAPSKEELRAAQAAKEGARQAATNIATQAQTTALQKQQKFVEDVSAKFQPTAAAMFPQLVAQPAPTMFSTAAPAPAPAEKLPAWLIPSAVALTAIAGIYLMGKRK